jgi:hypothetical protein
MAGFPSMDKGAKEYEAELGKWNWNEAQKQAGLPFASSGRGRAEKLVAEAEAAKLTKPYAKIGVVKGDLVFRIKHAGSKHFGTGDIVLVPGFAVAGADPKLSSKDKNQGVLNLSSERNPVSPTWWAQTRGTAPDSTGLDKVLTALTDLSDKLQKQPSAAGFATLLKLIAQAGTCVTKLRATYSAVNDGRIFDKLTAGLKAAELDARGRADTYQARIATALREAQTDLSKMAAGGVATVREHLRDFDVAIKKEDGPGVEAAWAEAKHDLEQIAAKFKPDHLSSFATFLVKKYGLAADAFGGEQLKHFAAEGVAVLQAASAEMKRREPALQVVAARGTKPQVGSEIKRLEGDAAKVAEVFAKIDEAIKIGGPLAAEARNNNIRNLDAFQWLEAVQGLLKQVGPRVTGLATDVAALAPQAFDEPTAKVFVADLRKRVAVWAQACRTPESYPGLKAFIDDVAQKPAKAAAAARQLVAAFQAFEAKVAPARQAGAALRATPTPTAAAKKALAAQVELLERAFDKEVFQLQIDKVEAFYELNLRSMNPIRFAEVARIYPPMRTRALALRDEIAALKALAA